MSQDAINDLTKRAAENAANSPVTFHTEEMIVETFAGQVLWEGMVRTYLIKNSVKPAWVYAWHVKPSPPDHLPQFVAVVRNPPITCALDAVRAWLVSQTKQ